MAGVDIIQEAVDFLIDMISIPAITYNEENRCNFIAEYLSEKGMKYDRKGNNLIVFSPYHNQNKPTLMLNAHIDTVPASESYSFDPFTPIFNGKEIKGLGSNDDGASVTTLLHTFLYFATNETASSNLNYNPLLVLSCEEERSGKGGISSIAEYLKGHADLAIIGEPTGMKCAVAERGLLVIDGLSHGVSGHAARNEGVNAISIAMSDITAINGHHFARISQTMGPVTKNITQINAGTAHNIIPDRCSFVIDIRLNELYTPEEIVSELKNCVSNETELIPRNLNNRSSATPQNSPLLKAVEKAGIETFVSPTTSDWMKIDIPTIKIGPGESSRSHKADEFIHVSEIENAFVIYRKLIESL